MTKYYYKYECDGKKYKSLEEIAKDKNTTVYLLKQTHKIQNITKERLLQFRKFSKQIRNRNYYYKNK